MKPNTDQLENFPLWTALITPLTNEGNIDYPTLQSLIKAQEDAGNALLLLGSTGEALNLDLEDKINILSTVLESPRKVPIMVGVGGINLKATLSWIKHLESLPIDAYLMVVPPYSRPGPEGQFEWFSSLLACSTRPVMIYNIPGRTGQSLDIFALQRLAQNPLLWAIKEASGSVYYFDNLITNVPHLKFYSGDDPLLTDFIPLGAVGLVSVASNPWPKTAHRYVQKALKETLRSEDIRLWKEVSKALFQKGNPVTVKHLQWKIKQLQSPICLPPLSHRENIDEAPLMMVHEKVKNWNI